MHRRFLHDPLHGIAGNFHLLVRSEHRNTIANQAQVLRRHKERPEAEEPRAHLDVRDEFRVGNRIIQMMPSLFDKFRKHGAAFLSVSPCGKQFARVRKAMTLANLFGDKAHAASRILDAVLYDVHDLQGKPKAHVQLRKFSLAFRTDKTRIRREKLRQELPDNACHIVAVLVEFTHVRKRKPARRKRSLLAERKLRHATAHFNHHITNRFLIILGERLQKRHHDFGLYAKILVRVFGAMPGFRKRSHKRADLFGLEFARFKHIGKQRKNAVLFGRYHVRVIFDRIGNAQIKVRKQNTAVQLATQNLDVQRKRTRHQLQDILGVLPRRLAFEHLLAHI